MLIGVSLRVKQLEPGAVAHEIRGAQQNHGHLFEAAESASEILAAQDSHAPEELARPWKRLDDDRQIELGRELLAIVRFGNTTEDLARVAKLEGDSYLAVTETVQAYHDALPFTRAERDWLDNMRFQAIEHSAAEDAGMSATHWVMAQSEEIVNLGRRQTVAGKELIGREWDWIRGGGDYKGNNTYEDARVALQGFVRLFDAPYDTGLALVHPPKLIS